ncbi:MAG: flagellar biosynthesis anti-sigma factor FlgM [Lachnospiraceae bacterium]|nr:flagellar biosynthesis anti-sigma factor FlgM [Lachnospiraceae bacterium]
MNIKFQTIGSAYRTPVATPKKRSAQTGKSSGNYDTVTIRRTQTDQESGFAQMLSRTAASQLKEGASMERVQELGRQVAAGTYHPDADRIAGRLLGLN